jgi:penicillin G amidase
MAELEPDGERERRALELLREWDNQLDPDTVAGTIYSAFMVHFARLVSKAAIGDPGYAERWRSRSQIGFTAMTSAPWRFAAHLLELWEEGDEDLVDGRAWDGLALESLRAALDDLERRHGADPQGWRWGDVHGLRFPHTLADGEHPLQPAFERLLSRRLRAGGGQETVCQIGFVPHSGEYEGHWAPSYRLLADAGDASRSRWQHFTGQSGHPGSPHYDDLMEDWLAGRTNPVRQPAVETLRLEPA